MMHVGGAVRWGGSPSLSRRVPCRKRGCGHFTEETGMPLRGWSGVVRYGVPGLLLGLAVMGGFGNVRGPSAQAENMPGLERPRAATPSGGDASGTIAFTTPSGGSAQLLYLIDTRSRAFAIYRV